MSKASQGIKLIKWLANHADDVAASADDLQRFGPQAAKVRSLLDFIPKMSDDAAQVSGAAWKTARNATWKTAYKAADDAARNATYHNARNAARKAAKSNAWNAAEDSGGVEALGDLITPNTYRILTNPLAAGREADIVSMNAPENVMDIIRGLGERNLIVNPQDVRSARKLAGLSDYERDPVMEYINTLIQNDYDGYRYPGSAYKSLKQMIEAARVM